MLGAIISDNVGSAEMHMALTNLYCKVGVAP